MQSRRTCVSSKLRKTRIVMRDRKLASHVPATRLFSRSQLAVMLKRYGMVYVKPDTGSLGIGVMRVEKTAGAYRYQAGTRICVLRTFAELYDSIRRQAGSRTYLVQKGIHVLRHMGRPFDFRIMIQKGPSGNWKPTGAAGRVAHPRKAVTNGSQGGSIYPVDALIVPLASKKASSRLLKEMYRMAKLTADRFNQTYPAMNELGLDIAVDRRLKPWLLEVNTRPDPCPFTKLPDKTMINTIVAYGKAYGRRYCLTCSKSRKGASPKRLI
ncbi:YheC/YheD family protein [Paenibacillus nasutitermitis]|uniref:YheC/YheD family protein n=1 Tax=Paenibacillus nasutitermitis TaxID=1652958 RepID=A0A916ZGZ2_9BACL|nr:YheC/YheD family protein [Paenibacillus nasutitermitis]GGD97784.1 hypothetical protein GCM10010911_65700 [Paenibacillus nasutitermitis]